jgi:1-acyl-sn-glycerol-3-phosphate acyltransferase
MVREGMEWLQRARRLVPPEDRRVLFSPPRLVARFVRYALTRRAGLSGEGDADGIEARDAELVTLLMDFSRGLGRHYFRLRLEGVEQVPPTGPVLLVGNHNGGLLPLDGFFTALAIHDRFGPSRAMYALAHDFLFDDPLLRAYALRLGMLRAGHESARHALRAGHCLLVYPGSDLDAFRAFRDRGRVILGGRKGFLKLALRERVPIVPVVSAGTHEQMIMLTRGDGIARFIDAHAWARADIFPLMLALPWGLMVGFVPYLPLPAQTTVAFGAPITWPGLSPADAEDCEALEHCYRDVEVRMQGMLDGMVAGRRFLLGEGGSSCVS